MNQQIRTLRRPGEIGRIGRVSTDHDNPSPVLEAVADGRGHRRVVDCDRNHLQAILLEHRPFYTVCRDHRMGVHARPFDRQVLLAVMRVSIDLVPCVCPQKATHHPRHPVWAVDVQRCLAPSEPALGHGLPQLSDVIRVKVRQKHAVQFTQGKSILHRTLGRTGADVDQIHLAAGDHRGARPRLIRAQQWRSGAAQDDVHRVVFEPIHADAVHHAINGAFHQSVLNTIA